MSIVQRLLVGHQTAIGSGTVPIGYAVDDTDVILLDEEGREVVGEGVGQIVIQSRYLSLGYWRRPELTAAAFCSTPGGVERRYHTGDIGRLLPDGCLVHLGRKDDQVKVRGFRVETA